MAKAKENLKARVPAFATAASQILVPHILDNGDEANCHGYTVNRKYSSIDQDKLLDSLTPNDNVVVFVSDGEIHHSARIENGRLIHYLIGTGVVSSPVGGSYGYERSFTLPSEKDGLSEYLEGHAKMRAEVENRKNEANRMYYFLQDYQKQKDFEPSHIFNDLFREVDENSKTGTHETHTSATGKFHKFLKEENLEEAYKKF